MRVLVRALFASCVAVAGVALGSACGTQNLEVLTVPPERACKGGQTEPVQIEELIRVFKTHDVEMFDDPECVDIESERRASNAPQFGPNPRRADAFDRVMRSQGYVHCDLLAHPTNPLQPVKENKYADDEETSLFFGNVRCVIYPDDDSEQEQVKRLRQAVSDLARAVARRQ